MRGLELNSTRKLRVGWFDHMDPMETSESSRRAVGMVVQALKEAGHEVVKWQPPNTVWALSEAFSTNVFGDGGKTFLGLIQNDIWEDHIKDAAHLAMIPVWLKKLLLYTVARLIVPKYVINYLRGSCGSGSVAQFWRDEADIKEYRRMVVQSLKKENIDVIICPTMPVPAIRIGECKDAMGVVVFTALFNLLNLPSGVVPVTKVTTEDVEKDMKEFPAKDIWHEAMKKNLEGSEGLPVTVQCVSLPYHEERCLRVMKELDGTIGYDVMKEYQPN